MVPPPPHEPLSNICNDPCNVQVTAFCVKCKKINVHFGCLRNSSTAIIKGMFYLSCAGCTPSFTVELSALDKITAVEKKLNCVPRGDSMIREVTMLRNEIGLIENPKFPFLKMQKVDPAGIETTAHPYITVRQYTKRKSRKILNLKLYKDK